MMSLFLQADFLPGALKETFTSSKEFEGWYPTILFGAIIFFSLTEPFKLVMRDFIGVKALNLVGIIAASTVYLSYGLLMLFICCTSSDNSGEGSSFINFYFSRFVFGMSFLFYAIFAFWVLFNGMKKYYIAKSTSLRFRDKTYFRGESVRLGLSLLSSNQDRNWYVIEPRLCFFGSLASMLVFPVIAFPILLTAISFWVNEWYQVVYKKERAKQSALDMMDEIKRANDLYDYSSVDNLPPSYVSTE